MMTPYEIAREMVSLADHHRAERGGEDSEADRVARELLKLHAAVNGPSTAAFTVTAFDDAHALGQARAYLSIADSALQSACAELAALGSGPRGAALPQRYCEDASELITKVRRMLLQAIQERR